MKLLQKTSRIYFLLTGLILLIAGVLIYWLLTSVIIEEVTEKLEVNLQRIVLQLERGDSVSSLPPVIEISRLEEPLKESMTIANVSLYDPVEEEEEWFREINSIRTIDGKSYQIILRQVILEPHDYLGTIGLTLGLLGLLLLVCLYGINRYIAKTTWKPFYQNLETLTHYALEDNQPIQLHSSDISEFEQLNQAIEKLTERIRSDYQNLKSFSENASHEMQTPLAIIQAKLEEALQETSLTEKQAAQINSALTASQRLSKLNQGLVLLSRIENHQFSQTQTIEVHSAITQQIEQLEPFLSARNIKLETHLEAVTLKSNSILMDILLSNLLGNAIKHNIENGKISISLNRNVLTISNTGRPLSQPPEQYFERFTKGDPTHASSGLGLSISKSICEANSWTIRYEMKDQMHIITVNL